jgi:putative nucleotidyltransferase with HDIG domain
MTSTGGSGQAAVSELEKARRLLSATAIRALAEDRWTRARPWLDGTALVACLIALTLLFAPPESGTHAIPPLDSIAAQTIRAERDLLVEDRRATALRRDAAEAAVLPVFAFDPDAHFRITDTVQAAVAAMAQRAQSATMDLEARRAAFSEDLGLPVKGAVFTLVEKVENPTDVATAINFFLNLSIVRMVAAERSDLPVDGGIQVQDETRGTVRPLHNLDSILDLDQLHRLMRARMTDAPFGSAGNVRTWILETAKALARPNLVPDPLATQSRRKAAREAIDPVYVRLAAGEVLIREGDRVTAAVQERIAMLNEGAERRIPWGATLAFGLLLAGVTVLGGAFFRRSRRPFQLGRKSGYLVLTIAFMSALLCVGTFYAGRGLAEGLSFASEAAPYLLPVALVTVLVSLLVDSRTSLLVGIVLALAVTYRVDGGLWLVTYYIVGVLAGGAAARRCRRRSDLLKAGLVVGLAQAATVPVVLVLSGDGLAAGLIPLIICALASGLLVAVCTTGLLPLLEHVFEEATDMRLLEMASADSALLKELAMRSPGTYYHSVMMGNLAEAAADVIGCNALQCRVMALYHDLGKMERPNYFAENQRDGNIHDRLEPELSARIIFAHIKDGIDIARKHRLGRAVIDAVTQHQGTTLLRVFHAKAVERAARTGETVDEAEFRYPGPRPATKEAAILLLADSVEAATRALKNPSPADVKARVRAIIEEKVADGQLDDSPLTLSDLARIEDAFTRVLTLGVYHNRIEYPPSMAAGAHHDQQSDRNRGDHRGRNLAG